MESMTPRTKQPAKPTPAPAKRVRKPPTFPATTTEDHRAKLFADIAAARIADDAAQRAARDTRARLEEATLAAMRAKLPQGEIVAACGMGRETVRVLRAVHGIEPNRVGHPRKSES
jgi:hypothetical protein